MFILRNYTLELALRRETKKISMPIIFDDHSKLYWVEFSQMVEALEDLKIHADLILFQPLMRSFLECYLYNEEIEENSIFATRNDPKFLYYCKELNIENVDEKIFISNIYLNAILILCVSKNSYLQEIKTNMLNIDRLNAEMCSTNISANADATKIKYTSQIAMNTDYISALDRLVKQYKDLGSVCYKSLADSKPVCGRASTYSHIVSCSLGSRETTGTASRLKEAKQVAAKEMLAILKEEDNIVIS